MSQLSSSIVVTLSLIWLYATSTLADHEWIVRSRLQSDQLPPNSSSDASHELLLQLLSKKNKSEVGFALRNEFYTMASGKDFYRLSTNDDDRKEYHAVAEATLRLFRRLPFMKAVNAAIRSAIISGARVVTSDDAAPPDIRKGMSTVVRTVDKALRESTTELRNEYERLKSEAMARRSPAPADYQTYYYEIPETEADAKRIVAESLNDPYLKRLMVHAAFHNETTKQHSASETKAFNFSLLAASIVELSTSVEYGQSIQTAYEDVVAETAEGIPDVSGANLSVEHTREIFAKIGGRLFENLSRKFDGNSIVRTKINEIRKSIRKDPAAA